MSDTRQQLAEAVVELIEKRGGWISSRLPLASNEQLRFEARVIDQQLPGELERLGLRVRVVSKRTRRHPAAVAQLVAAQGSRTAKLRFAAGSIEVVQYEVTLAPTADTVGSKRETSDEVPGR